jgi:2-iminobutanoate/2-iminopropanoate deaminase
LSSQGVKAGGQALKNYEAINEEWERWFPSHPPARYAAKLGAVIPGVLVSIRMTASVG